MRRRMESLVKTLPVGDRSEEHPEDASREERLTTLFRRWPALADQELSELRRLWEARVQRAKHGR
jgi:hypothetical protein